MPTSLPLRHRRSGRRLPTYRAVLLGGITLARPGLPAAPPAPPPYVPPVFERPPAAIADAQRLVYKSVRGVDLPIYVFAPPSPPAGPTAALIFFHGSGWHSGTLLQFVEHARALARQGISTAVVEYRVKVNYDATPFEGVADAKSALRWLRGHAQRLHLDPHRVAAAGASAGAHLALCAALFDGQFDDPTDDLAVSARPDLLVLFSVPTDLTGPEHAEEARTLFAGRERELSPLHHLRAGLPPMLIFQGETDTYVPTADTRRFVQAVEAQGDQVETFYFTGRGHAFYNHPAYYRRYPVFAPADGKTDYDLCLLLMTRFLRAHGYLHAPLLVPAADTTAGAGGSP